MTKKQVKNIFRVVLLVGTVISLFYVPWELVYAWILPLPDTVQQQVEEAVEKHKLDGIIVYVDKAGQPPAWYSAGWKDRANKIPANPKDLFKIGSVRKMYVALAITKLVNAGRLDLDRTLVEFFPELDGRIENADQITLRLLVQHRSGIPDYTYTPDYWTYPPETFEAKLDLILDQPAEFEPDADYAYSNTNYLLLGRIIDQTLGYDRRQYIKEAILQPNGLNNTYCYLSEVNMDDVMGGYYVGVEEDIKTTNYGGMLATAEDVGKFIRAMNDGSIFEDGEQEIYSSLYVYEHTGLVPGYQTIARYHKDMDAVVIQFVNTTNFNGYTWSTGEIVYSRVMKILRKGE